MTNPHGTAGHYCGQTQPHDPHTWQTPLTYDSTVTVPTYQCAGVARGFDVIAAAEQRGREDNADHSMCYVHGSTALEARLAQAWDEGRRSCQETRHTARAGDNPYRRGEETPDA
jgi:hypothetical protein